MLSAAGTGYSFNTKRNRLKDKMVIRKHDPFGKSYTINPRAVLGSLKPGVGNLFDEKSQFSSKPVVPNQGYATTR